MTVVSATQSTPSHIVDQLGIASQPVIPTTRGRCDVLRLLVATAYEPGVESLCVQALKHHDYVQNQNLIRSRPPMALH